MPAKHLIWVLCKSALPEARSHQDFMKGQFRTLLDYFFASPLTQEAQASKSQHFGISNYYLLPAKLKCFFICLLLTMTFKSFTNLTNFFLYFHRKMKRKLTSSIPVTSCNTKNDCQSFRPNLIKNELSVLLTLTQYKKS